MILIENLWIRKNLIDSVYFSKKNEDGCYDIDFICPGMSEKLPFIDRMIHVDVYTLELSTYSEQKGLIKFFDALFFIPIFFPSSFYQHDTVLIKSLAYQTSNHRFGLLLKSHFDKLLKEKETASLIEESYHIYSDREKKEDFIEKD